MCSPTFPKGTDYTFTQSVGDWGRRVAPLIDLKAPPQKAMPLQSLQGERPSCSDPGRISDDLVAHFPRYYRHPSVTRLAPATDSYGFTDMSRCFHRGLLPWGPIVD